MKEWEFWQFGQTNKKHFGKVKTYVWGQQTCWRSPLSPQPQGHQSWHLQSGPWSLALLAQAGIMDGLVTYAVTYGLGASAGQLQFHGPKRSKCGLLTSEPTAQTDQSLRKSKNLLSKLLYLLSLCFRHHFLNNLLLYLLLLWLALSNTKC